jgi:hypothetical protein
MDDCCGNVSIFSHISHDLVISLILPGFRLKFILKFSYPSYVIYVLNLSRHVRLAAYNATVTLTINVQAYNFLPVFRRNRIHIPVLFRLKSFVALENFRTPSETRKRSLSSLCLSINFSKLPIIPSMY